MAAPALPGDEEVRRLAAEILSQREYAIYRPDDAWLGSLVEVLRLFERFRLWMAELYVVAPLLYWLFLIGLLSVAALLLGHVVWSLRSALRAGEPRPVRQDQSPRDFVAEAEALASEGRFLDAARRMQLGCLELLLAGRVLELSRADPNRTLRRRIRQAALPSAQSSAFLSLLDRLEERTFRDAAADPDLYRGWLQLHHELRVAVGSA